MISPTPLNGLSDADLLKRMTMRDVAPREANEAWAEFDRRHRPYLHFVCGRVCYGLASSQDAEDLASDTLIRANSMAHHFESDGLTDHDLIRRRARAWLGRIAHNLWMSRLRSQPLEKCVDYDRFDTLPELVTQGGMDGEEQELVRHAFAQLSSREQEVIRATMQFHNMVSPHQRVPPEVVKDLASFLDTSPDNLRQIRARAFSKIRDYIIERRKFPRGRKE
jgi:RNA polymerase sigma factor (sigma-70 family)